MVIRNYVEKEKYYDSVFLMRLAAALAREARVGNISVGMGTPLNKDTMRELGLLTDEGRAASPNDLVIAIAAEDEKAAEEARDRFMKMLTEQRASKGGRKYRTLETMGRSVKDRNLAVISVAGQYAAAEAEKALGMGMDVFMFSDNVPIEQEVRLKTLARDKGLLMMGPDCGLSFINGIAIGLCSKVRRGNIGIAAACGSGMQEVMNIIHREGYGVSHAIGVGGRDLNGKVGGITMLQSLEILENDPDTRVIVLISKPPATEAARAIFRKVRECVKPVVAQFIHCDASLAEAAGAVPSDSFETTARTAIALSEGRTYAPESEEARLKRLEPLAEKEAMQMAPGQKYLRGLYCGGSLAEETLILAERVLGPMYGNIAFTDEYMLEDPFVSRGDCMVDIGAEEFTLGKPHVAIDPAPRISRFLEEARDPETAVILLDFLLGYSLCEDPAGLMVPAIREGKENAKREGRHLTVIASLCGSDLDPQGLADQTEKLKAAGVIVLDNNGEASRLAAAVIRKRREMISHG
ncbi:MAG: acyl-CoA synthetase FdrA [Clostridia bacterium]|nr:acyl-CoA synthetase FdrA [Clostridia bacterium]